MRNGVIFKLRKIAKQNIPQTIYNVSLQNNVLERFKWKQNKPPQRFKLKILACYDVSRVNIYRRFEKIVVHPTSRSRLLIRV